MLTPGRYVGAEAAVDDGEPFEQKMARLVATLEEMARALFRSWFVDFDPVRARAAGRQPAGMDAATAALFPDSFEETELGEVPRGWRPGTLGELCSGIFDGPHATPKKTENGPIFLGISNLASGHLDLASMEHLSETDFVQWTRRVLPMAGDVVFSYETRLGQAARIPPGLQCCLGRRMGLLRPNPRTTDEHFLLHAYLGPEFQETIRARTIHGSTVDRIPLTELPTFPLNMPPLPIQRAFGRVAGPLHDQLESNQTTARLLAQLRDALLPQLLSGEIRVREAEQALEAVL